MTQTAKTAGGPQRRPGGLSDRTSDIILIIFSKCQYLVIVAAMPDGFYQMMIAQKQGITADYRLSSVLRADRFLL